MADKPQTFKPVKDRRKAAPVKRITPTAETRKAYEDMMKERDQRAKDQQHLPEEMKGKR